MYRFKLFHESLQEYELQHAPVGWDSLNYKFIRDTEYHGMSREFSVELEFVKDGFDYIHTVYETLGINASILIAVYEQNPMNYRYELAYTGTIALDDWKVSDGVGSKARRGRTNIEFVGFVQQFVNGEDVEVGLHADTSVANSAIQRGKLTTVLAHAREIVEDYRATSTYASPAMSIAWDDDTKPDGYMRMQKMLFGFDDVENNELDVFSYNTGFVEQDTDVPLFIAKGAGKFRLQIEMKGRVEALNQNKANLLWGLSGIWAKDTFRRATFWLYMKVGNGEPVELYYHRDDDCYPGEYKHDYQLSLDREVEVQTGEAVHFYGMLLIDDIHVPGADYQFHMRQQLEKGSTMTINGSTQFEQTSVKGYMVHEAFDAAVAGITGKVKAFYSDLFGRVDSYPRQYSQDGEGSLLMLLNGFMLRGFPTPGSLEPPVDPGPDASWRERLLYEGLLGIYKDSLKNGKGIFTSFSELFKAMDAVFCIGAGVEMVNGEQVVRVEKREFFYQPYAILELGKVTGLVKHVEKERYYNEAEFGYKDWQIEDTNGLNEYNAIAHYTLPVTRVKGKYSAVCPYIASGYRMEMARRERFKTTSSKDHKDDDKVFLLKLRRGADGLETERHGAYSATEGIHSPETAVNLAINPVQMVKNHQKWLGMSFFKMEDKVLRFNKGEGDYDWKLTSLDGEVTEAGVNIPYSDFAQPYSHPETYEFEYDLSYQQLRLIRENPYGIIKFKDEYGNPYQGHILEIDSTGETKLTKFKLRRVYEA